MSQIRDGKWNLRRRARRHDEQRDRGRGQFRGGLVQVRVAGRRADRGDVHRGRGRVQGVRRALADRPFRGAPAEESVLQQERRGATITAQVGRHGRRQRVVSKPVRGDNHAGNGIGVDTIRASRWSSDGRERRAAGTAHADIVCGR